MRPRLDIALAALVAVLLVVVLVVVSTGGSESRPTLSLATSSATAGFDGAALPEGIPAPLFTLTDQYGRRVSLASTRGHVAVLAFLYSTCGDTCVVIAQQIRGALEELPHPVPVLIVSADPAADTRAREELPRGGVTERSHPVPHGHARATEKDLACVQSEARRRRAQRIRPLRVGAAS
jgi:protein SCO1/2